jgi:hypothetical protein
MKKLFLALPLVLAFSALATPAHAATAYLQSCNSTSSVTGRHIFVGVYSYGGQLIEQTFTSYCPHSIEIY